MEISFLTLLCEHQVSGVEKGVNVVRDRATQCLTLKTYIIMARVKLGFSRFAVSVKIQMARFIVSKMSGNANYPTPTPSLGDIKIATDDLELKTQAALKGGTDKTLEKNLAEKFLDGQMSSLADYVQVASGGDAIIIESSGMEVQKERSKAVILGPILNPNATVGGNPGEILLTWEGMPGAKSYVVEMQVPQAVKPLPPAQQPIPSGDGSDVMSENANSSVQWMRIDTVTVRRLLVKNLETGKVYSFRVAAINSAGQGDYSQVVSSVAK